MALSPDEALRFGRNVLLPEIGLSGQERLRASSVRIEGLGAVGSAAALYLAAAGIGALDLADDGDVEPADLAGTLYAAADVGTPRRLAAQRALAEFDPRFDEAPSGSSALVLSTREAADALLHVRSTRVLGCGGAAPHPTGCTPPDGVHPTRRGAPVLTATAAPGPETLLAGSLLALEAVKALLDIGDPLDREGLS